MRRRLYVRRQARGIDGDAGFAGFLGESARALTFAPGLGASHHASPAGEKGKEKARQAPGFFMTLTRDQATANSCRPAVAGAFPSPAAVRIVKTSS
jgi:hypothetical protein